MNKEDIKEIFENILKLHDMGYTKQEVMYLLGYNIDRIDRKTKEKAVKRTVKKRIYRGRNTVTKLLEETIRQQYNNGKREIKVSTVMKMLGLGTSDYYRKLVRQICEKYGFECVKRGNKFYIVFA